LRNILWGEVENWAGWRNVKGRVTNLQDILWRTYEVNVVWMLSGNSTSWSNYNPFDKIQGYVIQIILPLSIKIRKDNSTHFDQKKEWVLWIYVDKLLPHIWDDKM
jgi:hypothetical protein